MLIFCDSEPVQSYKSYKAEKFNKYKERARSMAKAVSATSLKPEDKKKLMKEIIEILQTSNL